MKLNNRLRSVASYVDDNTSIIDVGCDHALLSIFIKLNKKNVKVIASDVNEGPLKKAEENIKKYNLENDITLLLNDGIKNISGFDTIIISGMGGLTIVDILNNGDLKNVNHLILSPNNELSTVRKKITKLGYFISDEKIVKEKGKYYFILSFKRGKSKTKKFNYSEILIRNNDKLYLEYLILELEKLKRINKSFNLKKVVLKLKFICQIIKITIIIKKIEQ